MARPVEKLTSHNIIIMVDRIRWSRAHTHSRSEQCKQKFRWNRAFMSICGPMFDERTIIHATANNGNEPICIELNGIWLDMFWVSFSSPNRQESAKLPRSVRCWRRSWLAIRFHEKEKNKKIGENVYYSSFCLFFSSFFFFYIYFQCEEWIIGPVCFFK